MMTTAERDILIAVLEKIERQPDEDRKIAALRIFAVTVQGHTPDPADILTLTLPEKVKFISKGRA